MRAGAATIDVTPPAGMAMCGFAARSLPALGAHDPLTVRAVVVDDTALVVADVIGLHEAMSRRIRHRCGLPARNVLLAGLHTHGGPPSMEGRAGGGTDPAWLALLEQACLEAIARAREAARPATLTVGMGADPDIARNRRRPDGPVDRALPLLRLRGEDGGWIAVVTGYACHPVVLGADNRLWTADYPHAVRDRLEAAHPGAVALFATGCVGDLNTGHSAHASLSLTANPDRTFAAADRVGATIAAAALAAPEADRSGAVTAIDEEVVLGFLRREADPPATLADRWRREAATADPVRASLLGHWVRWAETVAPRAPDPWSARVSVLSWAGVPVIGLPGEIFAETALSIRARLGGRPALLVGFAEGNPGYIPPASEFAHGGYEVDEAHRYYGFPATFAPGSAEVLADTAVRMADRPTA